MAYGRTKSHKLEKTKLLVRIARRHAFNIVLRQPSKTLGTLRSKHLIDNDLLKAAQAYAGRGWPVFPCKPGEKVPLTKNGVLDATTDLRQITKWWTTTPDANIALDVGGAGMMVLDLDPGHDLEELEKNVGPIPQTHLHARTPRGGRHLYYTTASGELVSPSSSKLAPNVDVRSFHSYVLLPSSETKDGAYAWEADGKPAHRTDEMVRVANSAREKHEDRDNWIVEPDLKENVGIAIQWLEREAKTAIEGRGGEACAYATAAYLKSLAISEELALDLMLQHWNPRCDPPWGADEEDHLRQKVANAYRYNTSPPGNLTPGFRTAQTKKLFKPIKRNLPEGDEVTVAGFRFVDRLGMDHISEPKWIIPDLLADESSILLYGPWSTFKSFIALDIALSIAAGNADDPSWEVASPGPVLYMAGEGRSSLVKRVAGWEALHFGGRRVEDFVLVDPVPTTAITEEALDAFVQEALRRHPGGYRLFVTDTLEKAMAGADENSQRDAAMYTELMRRLRMELGGSDMTLHHSGAADDRRSRGSTVFPGSADTVLRTSRRGKDLQVSLHMTKQKDAPEWETEKRLRLVKVLLAPENSTLAAAPAPAPTAEEAKATADRALGREEVVLGVLDDAVRAILSANPTKCWTQKDLAEAVAMREDVSLDSKVLASTYLIRVRERKGTFASGAYDPHRNRNAGRWRCPG